MSTLSQDRTSNRVALCSAIFAGFAYVGYAVVRQVFGGKKLNNGFFRDENDCLGLEYETEPRGKVYLRRLSGSRCSGALESSVLRPLSVRERLRELNLNAMAFTDTLLILHGKKPLRGPRSLQSSPFHSPTRILSPLDFNRQFLLHEDSGDAGCDAEEKSCPPTPRLSRGPSRRNLSRRSLANSVVNLSEEEHGVAAAQAQTLLQDREGELTRRLKTLQAGRPRELTPYESRSLVALLHCQDDQKIARTLVTISNLAAFTRNQDLLREAGILLILPSLLSHSDHQVQLAAVRAAANLALNTGNMKEMEQTVLEMVQLADNSHRLESEPELLSQVFLSLTNLAVLPDWHQHFHPLLPRLLQLVSLTADSNRFKEGVKLQCLRLLVNLACNDDNIGHLLGAPCDQMIAVNLVSRSKPEDQLLRCVTLLANVYMAAIRLGLDRDQPQDTSSLNHVMFGPHSGLILREVKWITENTNNVDIKSQARKILTCIVGIN